jgi:SPP1 family predicted phage head-tail adaptor
MSGVSSGKLRHLVQLQVPLKTQNPMTGAMEETWANYGSKIWAEIVPSSAREFVAAGAEQSEVRGRITIRSREGVNATMRFLYRGRKYAILGLMPDAESLKGHMTLMIGEGVIL